MITKEIEKIKRSQIEDFESTKRTLEFAVAFEKLTLECQELFTKHIIHCEMRIAALKMELSSAELSDTLYAICNPNLYAHV